MRDAFGRPFGDAASAAAAQSAFSDKIKAATEKWQAAGSPAPVMQGGERVKARNAARAQAAQLQQQQASVDAAVATAGTTSYVGPALALGGVALASLIAFLALRKGKKA